MKLMFTLMDECSQRFAEYFKKQGKDSFEVELRDVFTRFTNDVIATTAFGIECNSLQNRTNEFYMMGKDITNFTGLRSLKFFALSMCPQLMKVPITAINNFVVLINFIAAYWHESVSEEISGIFC